MRFLPFIFAAFLFLVGCGDSLVNVSVKTVERNGTTYAISKDGTSNVPYTGSRSSFYGNGQLKEKKTFKRGTPEGPYKVYHENGQLRGRGPTKMVSGTAPGNGMIKTGSCSGGGPTKTG